MTVTMVVGEEDDDVDKMKMSWWLLNWVFVACRDGDIGGVVLLLFLVLLQLPPPLLPILHRGGFSVDDNVVVTGCVFTADTQIYFYLCAYFKQTNCSSVVEKSWLVLTNLSFGR